jgi:S-adenosylmethionine hydrolase
VTLLTDFGLSDCYVAEVKAVLYGDRQTVDPAVVDITHLVPPQDVRAGGFVLERAVRAFPTGTIHIAVVDPGVGSERRLVVVRVNGQIVLAADNGLITWAWRRLPTDGAYELTWRPRTPPSNTFHGRDVFAPAALMLARRTPLRRLARPIDDPILLDLHAARSLSEAGTILHIDHFGNAITNVPAELLADAAPRAIRVGRRAIPFARTYADVPQGKPLALIGSSGLLEIAIRNGHAARQLKLAVGIQIGIER